MLRLASPFAGLFEQPIVSDISSPQAGAGLPYGAAWRVDETGTYRVDSIQTVTVVTPLRSLVDGGKRVLVDGGDRVELPVNVVVTTPGARRIALVDRGYDLYPLIRSVA